MNVINQRYLGHRINKFYRKLKAIVLRNFYQDNVPDLEKSILLVGSARSGTTWLANMIASQFKSRIMFEPFNPDLVPEYRQFNYFQYMRPDDQDQDLSSYCHKVFTGDIRNAWIDREIQYLYPQGRVIKCIRATLMLKWLDNQFPAVPKILIIRHPCAVVLSRMRLGWATDDDIRHFLLQPDLIADFLEEKLDIIENAKSDVQKHAIIWCITNLVPIRQFDGNELHLVRYEHLVKCPGKTIENLFDYLQLPYEEAKFKNLRQPSLTVVPSSAVLTGENLISDWENQLTIDQINEVLGVVREFGLLPVM